MAVKVVTPPDAEPISLEEAKSFLHGIDYDDQDANISAFIQSARLKLEKRCGRAIAQQEFEITLPTFGETIELMPPVTSVESVKYIDSSGDEQTIDAADYELIDDELTPYIFPLVDWPTDIAKRPNAVRIRFIAGNEPEEVPEDLKQAIRLLVGSAFEMRQSEMLGPTRQELLELSDGIPELIAPYVVMRL